MKSNLSPPLALALCLSIGACASTETGNPTKPKDVDAPLLTGTPIKIGVGLRSSLGGTNISTLGPRVSGLWLRVSEIDLVTCTGVTNTTSQLSTPVSLSAPQALTISSPDEEVCAVVVRTEALQVTDDGSVPQEAAGQGALVQGSDYGGFPFSATVPSRITSVLTPTAGGLTLTDVPELHLVIEDTLLLGPLPAAGVGQATRPTIYDAETTPDVVEQLATQLSHAFTLVRGTAPMVETLASSVAAWDQVDDLLCTADCAQQDRLECGQPACDTQACIAELMEPNCGQAHRDLLDCRVGLNLSELTCDGLRVSALNTHCAEVDALALSCKASN